MCSTWQPNETGTQDSCAIATCPHCGEIFDVYEQGIGMFRDRITGKYADEIEDGQWTCITLCPNCLKDIDNYDDVGRRTKEE